GESVLEALVSTRRLLTAEQWERMQELVVFEPTSTVPINTVARLWAATGNLDPVTSELLSNRLSQVNLVRFDSTGVRLTDILRSYLSHDAQFPVRALHMQFL